MHRYLGVSALLLLIPGHFPSSLNSKAPAAGEVKVSAIAQRADRLLNEGLSSGFEANVGQADSRYDFLARRGQVMVYLSAGDVAVRLSSGGDVVQMKLIGRTTRPRVRPIDRLRASINYYRGPRGGGGWHSNVPTYSRVEYRRVYRGVDLAYYFDSSGRLEHDFVVAPGANPGAIRFRIDGARTVHLDEDGNVQLQTTNGAVTLRRPVLYQIDGQDRQPVKGRYVIRGAREIGFDVGAYDRRRPLLIDPVVYATYLGGYSNDEGLDVAVDADGNAYVTGFAMSADFPLLNPWQPSVKGWQDAFVAKFNAAGALQYSTYLGGTGTETGQGIAVGSGGVVHVTGQTFRYYYLPTDFPTTPGAFQTDGKYDDAFVAKLDATGALVASTLFGGTYGEDGADIAVDAQGNSYITGFTWSSDLPLARPLRADPSGHEAFAAKLNAGLTALEYSTYLGGSSDDHGRGIAVDAGGNAIVVGDTASRDFPTVGALQPSLAGATDAFVAKLDASGTALVFSTYFGGGAPTFAGGREDATAVAVDATGDIVFGGQTNSTDLPVAGEPSALSGPANPINGSYFDDAFVAKLTAAGALLFSRYLGGNETDTLRGLSLARDGSVYATGVTRSTNFPKAAGLNDAGAFSSADGGSSWTSVRGGLDSAWVTAILVDPSMPTTIYAGTERDGIFKSTDGGLTWQRSSQGLSTPFVTALVIDPSNTATLYAGTDGARVFKTTDGAATWKSASMGLYVPHVISLAIAPTNPQTLFAGTIIRGGAPLYRTVNGGAAWSSVLGGFVEAVAVDPSSSSVVYAARSITLYKSVDGGTTWTLVFEQPNYRPLTSIAIDPISPATVYVGTDSVGVYKSADGGATWAAASNGLTTTSVTALTVDPVNPGTIYAGTYGGGVFKSGDGAATWTASNAGIANTKVTQIAVNPQSPGIVHAGVSNLFGDAFLAVLTGSGTLYSSTRVGGGGFDSAAGVAATPAAVYLTGSTRSRDYPTTPDALRSQFSGGYTDGFFTRLECVSPITLTSIATDPGVLWPPDHGLVPVSVDYQVRGACGAVTCSIGVESNEPPNGTGDGDAEPDWQVIDARRVMLRAERAGFGAGRTYTLRVTCSDAAERPATGSGIVTVPVSIR